MVRGVDLDPHACREGSRLSHSRSSPGPRRSSSSAWQRRLRMDSTVRLPGRSPLRKCGPFPFLSRKFPDGGASIPAIPAITTATRHERSLPRLVGIDVADAIEDTLEWLRHPERWADNAGRGDASDDKPLARIQFAGALASAVDSRLAAPDASSRPPDPRRRSAPDGSWRLDASESVGAPATYGLRWPPRRRGERWRTPAIRAFSRPSRGPIAGCASTTPRPCSMRRRSFWVSSRLPTTAAVRQRQRSLWVIEQGQGPGGGWGPYATSAPEPFDTAVVLLALCELSERAELATRRSPTRSSATRSRAAAASSSTGSRRRQLAGNHAALGPGELRAAHLDNRMGGAGALRVKRRR